VHEFDARACPALPPLDGARCAERHDVETIPYHDRDADAYLREHAAPSAGGEPVDVVRHAWIFTADDGPPESLDCVIARCSAVRR
jgi:hypothetical protein